MLNVSRELKQWTGP